MRSRGRLLGGFARRLLAGRLGRLDLLDDLERTDARHGDGRVAAIDKMYFARDRSRQVRQKIERGAADLIERRRAAHRRMALLEMEQRARIRDAGASERAHRPCGERIYPDILRPKV